MAAAAAEGRAVAAAAMLPPGDRRTVGPSKRSFVRPSVRPSIRPTDQPSTLLSLSATNHPVHDG